MGLAGALSIAFGLVHDRLSPGPERWPVVWWIGAYALAIGLMLVVLGFRARGLAHSRGLTIAADGAGSAKRWTKGP